jgi:hypothetical protein
MPKPCFLCGEKGHTARDCINQQVRVCVVLAHVVLAHVVLAHVVLVHGPKSPSESVVLPTHKF